MKAKKDSAILFYKRIEPILIESGHYSATRFSSRLLWRAFIKSLFRPVYLLFYKNHIELRIDENPKPANLVTPGIIHCEIKTPQFRGSQDNFWMKNQTGLFNYRNLLFTPDDNPDNDKGEVGKHRVQFHSLEDFKKARIK